MVLVLLGLVHVKLGERVETINGLQRPQIFIANFFLQLYTGKRLTSAGLPVKQTGTARGRLSEVRAHGALYVHTSPF